MSLSETATILLHAKRERLCLNYRKQVARTGASDVFYLMQKLRSATVFIKDHVFEKLGLICCSYSTRTLLGLDVETLIPGER